jgi:hypothetical protein
MARAHSACLRVVEHAREQPAQLDCGSELAVLLEDGADCSGIGLSDNEHAGRMGRQAAGGKRPQRRAFLLPGR